MSEKTTKGRRLLIIVVVSLGILLLACIGCFGLSAISDLFSEKKTVATVRVIPQATEALRPLDTPVPTETASTRPTATRNPLSVPTATPALFYNLILPQEVKSADGWVFAVNRIELLNAIDTPSQRYKPKNGTFLVMIGKVSNLTDKDGCIHGEDFVLRNGAQKYEMAREIVDAVKDIYHIDYPGFVLGQCLDYDRSADSYLVFDAPKDGNDLWLLLKDAEVQIGQMSNLSTVTPTTVVTPIPGPTDTPTPAPTPTPIDTPILSPTITSSPVAQSIATATDIPEATPTERVTRSLPGLMPADVTGNLEQRGFTCSSAEQGQLYYTRTCKQDSAAYSLHVDIYGQSFLSVDLIESVALQFANPDNELAASFLGFMATMPYDGALPKEARSWVETTIPTLKGQGDVREKVFAGVKYSLYGPPTAISLEMGDLP